LVDREIATRGKANSKKPFNLLLFYICFLSFPYCLAEAGGGMNKKGWTLLELVIAASMTALLILVTAKLFSSIGQYFHNTAVRQQLQSDADRTMNSMIIALQKAKANTVTICTCGANVCIGKLSCIPVMPPPAINTPPPNSRIEFFQVGATAKTAIYWDLPNTVYLQPAGMAAQPLANNVTGLMFTGDGTDFSRVYISLRMDAPISRSQTATVVLPDQVVRLVH
jgi:type II secretory pathway pseudopilin PulG